MMLLPKKNIKLIYEYVLNEGVIVVKKDVNAPKHSELAMPNLHVMQVMQSLKSRGYVTEQFSWQYHYYTLTDEGIAFLRSYLHVPETVVPATMAKSARTFRAPREAGAERPGPGARRTGGQQDYRRGGWRGEGQQTAQKAAA